MKRLLSILALAACAHAPRAASPAYDLVLTGGRLVDGTGNPWTYADVAVRGGRVVRVAPGGALAGAPARERVSA